MANKYNFVSKYDYEWVELYKEEKCAFCGKKMKKLTTCIKGYCLLFPSGETSDYYCSIECAKAHRGATQIEYQVTVEANARLNKEIKEENEKNRLSERR